MAATGLADQGFGAVSRPGAGAGTFPRAFLVWILMAAMLVAMTWNQLNALALRDTDDLMRLVQVRDFLAGQHWFDVMQYRLNAPEGILMHWSRLADLPVAGLILLGEMFGDRAVAERFAVTATPLLALLLLLWGQGSVAAKMGGPAAAVLAMLVSVTSVPVLLQVMPLRIDHHMWQLVLMAAAVRAAIAPPTLGRGALAGAALATMLAIGAESLPYIAAIVAWASVRFVRDGARSGAAAALGGLGAGLAIAALFWLFATVPADRWFDPYWDALSGPLALIAVSGGAGLLWLACFGAEWRSGKRALALAVVGLLGVLPSVLIFPGALGGPLGAVDPFVRSVWLAQVGEAKSVIALLMRDPAYAMIYLWLPVAGLISAMLMLRDARERDRDRWGLILLLVAAALAISAIQLRGITFAAVPAAIAAASVLAERLRETRKIKSPLRRAAASAAYLVLLSGGGGLLVSAASDVFVGGNSRAEAAQGRQDCESAEALTKLRALPQGIVLGQIDLGPAILARTGHSVLAGPYHRNSSGIGDAARFFLGTPEQARAVALRRKVDYVAFCADHAEARNFARRAPDGMTARLMNGERDFAGFRHLPGNGPLILFEVVR